MYKIRYNKIPKNMLVSNIEEEGKTLFEEGFGELFDIKITPMIFSSWRVNEAKCARYDFTYKYSSYKNIFMKIYVNEDDEILYKECIEDNNYVCKHFFALVRYVESINLEVDVEEFEKEFNRMEEQKRQELYKKNRKESLLKLSSFIDNIEKYDTMLQNEKMSIECRILTHDLDKLSIRVGGSKKYVVNNIKDFVNATRNQTLLQYGKSFSFVHSIDAFDEFSQNIISFLASFTQSEYASNKEIFLSPIKMQSLIELYKDNYLYIDTFNDDTKYKVSNEKINPKFYLDKDMVLKIPAVDCFLEGYSKDYLVFNKKIYELENKDLAYRKLFKLVMNEFEGLKFEYIKDVFEKKIYPRFSENIEVNPEIKSQIKTVEYNIKSYFDYEDDAIVCTSKYYIGEKRIDITKLKEIPYKIKRYNSYINNLGFVENKIASPNLIYNFLHSDLTDLKKLTEIYLSENLKQVKAKKLQKMAARMSYQTGMLDICFEESGFTNEQLYAIINSLKKKIRYIKLDKETILEVDEEDAEKLLNTVNSLNLDIKKLNEVQNVPLYQSLKFASDEENLIDYKLDESLSKLIEEIIGFKDLNIKVPKSLEEVMRDYQKDAFKWMTTLSKHNFCGILADDMGLGKTLEVISVIFADKTKSPSLIVCPKSLCYNWKNEFSLWAKDIEVINVIGSVIDRKNLIEKINNKEKKIYVSSYDSLRNDIDFYKSVKFNYLILDEAQSIKNHNTLKAKSVKKIKSNHRFVLTGTPIENSVVDLWSIFDFLMPEYLGDYSSFRSRYEEAVVTGNADEVVGSLIKKISPFVLRRTKKEVLKDLPDKIETIQIASMDDSQRLIYEAQLLKTKEILTNPNTSKIEILSCLTRLRQICVHPGLFMENYKGTSAKFDLLFELLDDYIKDGHKVIIFSQFTSAFELLTPALNEKHIEFFILTGKTPADDRLEMANKFNEPDDNHKVFLVSLKAGGTGLNLVGADIVVHLDPWWNYAVENQATDRAHRIGQKNVVQVVKLICENSIEQKVIELQNIKKEVAERIILSDEENYKNINLTDIKYLLD